MHIYVLIIVKSIKRHRFGNGGKDLDSHSEWLFPFGAVRVVAFLCFLGLAFDCHFHIGTGTKPVFLVLFQFC